jgi:hypothetical protein
MYTSGFCIYCNDRTDQFCSNCGFGRDNEPHVRVCSNPQCRQRHDNSARCTPGKEYPRRESVLYCQLVPGHEPGTTYMTNFYPHPEVTRLCSSNKPVYKAVVSEGVDTPGSYWAWWDNKDGRFHHVYGARMLVDMCFPYGAKTEEQRARGRLHPVTITLGGEIPKPAKSQ